MRRSRPHQRIATSRWLWSWGIAASLAVVGWGCWRDLPSVVSANPQPGDAAVAPPPPATSLEDAARIVLSETADGATTDAGGTGQVALTVSLPVDTATGQLLRVGSLNVRLQATTGTWSRSLWVELGDPLASLNLNLDDVAAGGPYRIEISAAPNGTTGCAGSSPTFSVLGGETVSVFEALICSGDAGLAPTFSDPAP